MTTAVSKRHEPSRVGDKIADAVLNLVGHVPKSAKMRSMHPDDEARRIARLAARKAAMTAGGLALPPGPLGWITVLPELLAVWKLQTQMVADIAGVYDSNVELTKEQMLYCLFRHTAAQAVRDLVVRIGERYLVGKASSQAFQIAARKVGLSLTRHAVGSGISRWMPVVGAVGVGAYAYYDTSKVAKTAIEMFSRGVEVEVEGVAVIERPSAKHDSGSGAAPGAVSGAEQQT